MSKPATLGQRAWRHTVGAYVGTVAAGRYRLDHILALGGMGAVFRAEHIQLKRQVALKLICAEAEGFTLLAARMQREALVGAHLAHDHIAEAFDFGELDDGSRFLVSELVPGRTLRDIVKQGPLGAERAVGIARQLASALGHCHAHGVIHRDLKPSNVMVTEGPTDTVKLIDFGLARVPVAEVTNHGDRSGAEEAPEENLTEAGIVFGTIAYMAPETALGMSAVDARSDLYALGVMLYEMLSGKHPFDAADPMDLFIQHRFTEPPAFAVRAPEVTVAPALQAIVMRLLSKRPADRHQTAAALLAELDRADLLQPHPATNVPLPSSISPLTIHPGLVQSMTPALPPRRSSRRHALALASVTAMLGLGVFLSSARAPEPPWAVAAAAQIDPRPVPCADPPADLHRAAEQSAALDRFRADGAAGRSRAAAQSLAKLLEERGPVALRDGKDRRLAARVALRAAMSELPGAVALYDALATRAGSDGVDVLYEIVEGYGGTVAADLAWARLVRADVRRQASPAAAVAIALREASCKTKDELFDRAGREGDERAARTLDLLRSTRCDPRRGECCYHGNASLKRAVASIEQRSAVD